VTEVKRFFFRVNLKMRGVVAVAVGLVCTHSAAAAANTWMVFGSSEYYLDTSPNTKSWDDAQSACLQKGAALVTIDSQAKWNAVSFARNTGTNGGKSVWIGCRRTDGGGWNNKGVYKWQNGNECTRSTNGVFSVWADGEPSDGSGESCVEMNNGKDWKWNDEGCGRDGLIFLCERDVTTTVTATTTTATTTTTTTTTTTSLTTSTSTSTTLAVPEWVSIGSSEYHFSSNTKTWEAARTACTDIGGFLATINSESKMKAIIGLIPDHAPADAKQLWIGCKKSGGGMGWNNNGVYKWIQDGGETECTQDAQREDGTTVYSYWMDGQPSDFNNEDCVTMVGESWGKDWRWNDDDCDRDAHHYLCEKRLVPTTTAADATITEPINTSTDKDGTVSDTTTSPDDVTTSIAIPAGSGSGEDAAEASITNPEKEGGSIGGIVGGVFGALAVVAAIIMVAVRVSGAKQVDQNPREVRERANPRIRGNTNAAAGGGRAGAAGGAGAAAGGRAGAHPPRNPAANAVNNLMYEGRHAEDDAAAATVAAPQPMEGCEQYADWNVGYGAVTAGGATPGDVVYGAGEDNTAVYATPTDGNPSTTAIYDAPGASGGVPTGVAALYAVPNKNAKTQKPLLKAKANTQGGATQSGKSGEGGRREGKKGIQRGERKASVYNGFDESEGDGGGGGGSGGGGAITIVQVYGPGGDGMEEEAIDV
jgi:hypothetical protein